MQSEATASVSMVYCWRDRYERSFVLIVPDDKLHGKHRELLRSCHGKYLEESIKDAPSRHRTVFMLSSDKGPYSKYMRYLHSSDADVPRICVSEIFHLALDGSATSSSLQSSINTPVE